MGLAFVVIEEYPGRTVQLGNDDPLGTVDNEGAGIRHEGQFAHVDFLLLHVLDALDVGGGVTVIDDQAHQHAQGRCIGHATQLALTHVEHGLAETIAYILERSTTIMTDDGEY